MGWDLHFSELALKAVETNNFNTQTTLSYSPTMVTVGEVEGKRFLGNESPSSIDPLITIQRMLVEMLQQDIFLFYYFMGRLITHDMVACCTIDMLRSHIKASLGDQITSKFSSFRRRSSKYFQPFKLL